MLVKELADKTGISRHTINNYLNVREHIPTIDVAVKIAHALGVSVEYLATGKETAALDIKISREDVTLVQDFNSLSEGDRKIVAEFVQLFRKHRRK